MRGQRNGNSASWTVVVGRSVVDGNLLCFFGDRSFIESGLLRAGRSVLCSVAARDGLYQWSGGDSRRDRGGDAGWFRVSEYAHDCGVGFGSVAYCSVARAYQYVSASGAVSCDFALGSLGQASVADPADCVGVVLHTTITHHRAAITAATMREPLYEDD